MRYRLKRTTEGLYVLERLVGEGYTAVGYLDPRYAQEVVDVLTAVPIAHLQKQVAVMADTVDDILARLTRMGRGMQ